MRCPLDEKGAYPRKPGRSHQDGSRSIGIVVASLVGPRVVEQLEAKFRTQVDKHWSIWANTWLMLGKFGQHLAVKFGYIWSMMAELGAKFGQQIAKFDQNWPMVARVGQNCPSLGQIDQHLAEPGRIRPRFCQHGPRLGEHRPILVELC